MKIPFPSLLLHFKAHAMGSVGARVALANRNTDHYWKALVAISNRERSIASDWSSGRLSPERLIALTQRLVDHRCALAYPGRSTCSFEAQLQVIRNWDAPVPMAS